MCLSGISMERYCRKSLAKSGGFGKDVKRGDSHIGGLSIEEGLKPSAHYDLIRILSCLNITI